MSAPPATEHPRSRERAPGALAPAVLGALEEAPLGLAVFDRELRLAHVNTWLAEVDGFPAPEHVGRTMAELFPDLPDAVRVVESRVRAVLETGEPTTFSIVRSAPAGTRREWVATYCPIRGPSSDVEGACGIILEVTAERDREAALTRSRLEAERAARRLAYLQDVTAALAAATGTADVAKVIVDRARPLVGAASATIRVLREGTLELLAASGDFELRSRPRSISLEEDAPVACAVRRGEPIWLHDRATIERRFPALVAVHGGDAAIASVPLSAGGRRLGALSFAFDQAQRFDLEERAGVLAAAAQCAQALDRALLHEAETAARDAAQRASAQVARLQGVTAALSAASTVEEVAAVVVEAAHAALGAHTVVIYVNDPGTPGLSLAATVGHADAPRRLARLTVDAPTPAAHAARTGEASWMESPEELAARFPGFASVYPPARAIGALAALPLRARGKVLGSLGFAFEAARRFEPEERDLLSSVADQCGQALDRARLLDAERAARAEAQRVASRLARLQEITAALSAARTVEDIARTVTELVHPVVGAAVSSAYVLEPDGALRLLRLRGADPELAERYARIPAGSPFPICRAATGQPVWLGAPAEVVAAFPQVAVLRDAPREAVIALPLRAGEQVIGAFSFTFAAPRRLDDAERGFFLAVAEQCAIALHRAQLLEGERRAREEADRARSLLDAILENAPIGIGFFDPELRFQRLNPKLAEMNGLPLEAHLGRTPRELFPGIPNDEIERGFRRVLATGEPLLDVELVGETPGIPRRQVWRESWYPVQGGGALMGVGAVVRDVTKEREAEEFQRHVVGVVGHDLRNPLSAILTAVKLLAAGEARPAQARLLERVAGCAGRIQEIVGALLDFANVRAGVGVPIRPGRCDLAEVARGVAEECALAHPGREILCAGTGDCTGEWDPGRVAQLLANLVTNAIQYSPPSAPVRLGWAGNAGEVLLEVANAGPPIPAALLPHLFEPFRRGDGQARGGLGLGLFIARAIAVAHRGRIDVRCSEPEGTVFSVTLPRG